MEDGVASPLSPASELSPEREADRPLSASGVPVSPACAVVEGGRAVSGDRAGEELDTAGVEGRAGSADVPGDTIISSGPSDVLSSHTGAEDPCINS